jgi:hypothetical protein
MRFWIAALSVAALLFSGNAALAEKRVAFVIGNGAYKNVPQLPNPPIDAKTMASTLRNVGFDVVEGYNLTRDKMTEKLLEFGHKAEGADMPCSTMPAMASRWAARTICCPLTPT